MKVSGFTFLRNAQMYGYPFVYSIRSVLPLVDEFVIALGPCEDDTEAALCAIGDAKLRIIHTSWNETLRNDRRRVRGFVYGQQKSIALFNCTGDWAFYLEADEVVHENDIPVIRAAMERHLNDDRVEALAFDYLHFYGNGSTYAWSPGWYRKEVRVLRNNVAAWGPEGLFFVVLDTMRKGRYPRAAHAGATIYHYGWCRGQDRIQLTKERIERHWSNKRPEINLAEIDPRILRPFTGTHPAAIRKWIPSSDGLFRVNPEHKLTARERRHRWTMRLEAWLGLEITKKHYTPVGDGNRDCGASDAQLVRRRKCVVWREDRGKKHEYQRQRMESAYDQHHYQRS